jgi:hypothetical protein
VLADDPNPYYLGVTAGVTHDNNVFRLPSNVQGDTSYSGGLIAGIDQPFGRQHFTASGNVKYNRFSHLTDLNNTSYGLNTRLDWQALDRLSGTASLIVNQNLAAYNTYSTQVLTKRNLETDGQFLFRAQYGLVSTLSLDGQYTHEELRYSAAEYTGYETAQDTYRLGVKYRPSGLLALGASFQTAHARYPGVHDGNGNEQTYDRNDFVLTGTWTPTGQSSIDARASVGRQSFSHSNQNDFSGVTGQVVWNYVPTGKLSFTTTFIHDTGFATSFVNLANQGGGAAVGDNSHLATSIGVSARYAATGKIGLNGGVRYVHRSLRNTIDVGGGNVALVEGSDSIQSEYLGVTYTPLRSLQLGCNISHDSRTVSGGTPPSLSYPFSDMTFGCSAQLVLQ